MKPVGIWETMQHLKSVGFDPKVVWDVGAATGEWTKSALQIWPDAYYIMFEPLEERRQELGSVVTAHKNVKFVAAALGRERGQLNMYVNPDLNGSSLSYGEKTRPVTVQKVDWLTSPVTAFHLPSPNFMKIDVQGFEMEVLEGAKRTLTTCEVVLVELNMIKFDDNTPMFHEVVSWMNDHGYVFYEFADYLRRPLDNAMGQCDIVFVNKASPLVQDKRWCP